MKLRMKGIALTAAALAVTLMVGCGGGAQPDGPGGAGGDAAGASAWAITGGVHEKLWRGSFDTWNEKNPDREFSVEMFSNDSFKEKIRTAVGAGNSPTLIYSWAGGQLQQYVDTGKVVDLSDGTRTVMDRVVPSVAQAGIIDDKVYAVPNGQSQPIILFYNKELMEKAGVEVPQTWDELMAAVKTLRGQGIAPFSVAGQSRWPYLMWIEYLTDRAGGPEAFEGVVNGEKDAWSHPAFTEALTKIQDLVKAEGFASGYGSVSSDANADLALLHTGKAAMMLQGAWAYSLFKADAAEFVADGKLGVAMFPTVAGGEGDPANIVGNPSNYWSISADAAEEDQATAMEFLDGLWDAEYADVLISGGGVPPVKDIEAALGKGEDPEFLNLVYEMVTEAPHFELSWDQALEPDQAQELLINLEQIFLLQQTPEEFVTAMNATIE